ncbi:IclR family transcriptional regulator [Reyranella sp.]|uniref:IclR family transcriptional regulator n=1 Tax=Reyranella sp. TaxID=1929291 RepID=UPI0012245F43|nr:IclR family transcriptional regulator C-terminal domain-containing protein [Reyranella sp.]TAJ82097.1 MAG: IclR family transcriptional regulator [Reyranella sp.]
MKTTIRHGARTASRERTGFAESKLVKPVVSAIRVLELLSRSSHSMTLTEIVRELAINPSTGLAILRTLVAMRIVGFEAKSKSYHVGTGMVALAEGVLGRQANLEVLRPAMTKLASKFRVTVVFWEVADEHHLRLAAFSLSDADIQIQMRIGQRLPIWAGAVGRLVAGQSDLTPFALRRKFSSVRWQSPPTFDAYRREVASAAREGFAVDDGNFLRGVLSIAAPVFGPSGRIALAFNAVTFSGQLSSRSINGIAQELVELARLAGSSRAYSSRRTV